MSICGYGLESDLLLINTKKEKDYIIETYEDVALRYSWSYPKPRYIKYFIFSSIDNNNLIKLTNNILDEYNLYSDTFNFKICYSNCYIEIIIKDNKYGVIRNTKIKVIFIDVPYIKSKGNLFYFYKRLIKRKSKKGKLK